MRRAMLSRRRRFVTETTGVFETPHEIRIVHEIPRKEAMKSKPPIPEPREGEFVGPVCPSCGAWGEGICASVTGRDHPSRRRAILDWYDSK